MSKKICILTDSLSFGGAERVAANLSVALSKKKYQVFIVSMTNNIEYPFKGELYNFGLVKQAYGKFLSFFKLKHYFSTQKFDVIIDHRLRDRYLKEVLFSKLIFRKNRVLYCIHSYNLSYYFSFLNIPRITAFKHVKNKKFICVSAEIENHLKELLKLKSTVIYNFFKSDIYAIENNFAKEQGSYIISVGRLAEIKQFDTLIKCYSKSELPKNNIKLLILGDGEEKDNLELLVSKLNLTELVELIPFKKNPYNLISNAKALVLTSKVEGFPMVLLESLFLKTPVISFDCKSGPNEIIINEVNGLLVENQNEDKLTLALNRLTDESFYSHIKTNTHVGLEKFSEDAIVQEWINVLENQI
jgi:glycosyltransferase involved in cell wall biosynthesis